MDFRANKMRKRNDPSFIIGRGSDESIDLTTWMVNGHKLSYDRLWHQIMNPVIEGYDVTPGDKKKRGKKEKNDFVSRDSAVYLHQWL